MDKEAQGENSSSQNVNLEVVQIEGGASCQAKSIGLSDGSSFFMHRDAVLEFSISVGTVLTHEQLDLFLCRSAVYAARDKAVEYLARREHSSNEIILKLRKKGYDDETADDAVRLLVERGYVDDRRFARMWIDSRLKKHPEGRSSLAAGLARKGVPREVANDVLNEKLTAELQDDALARSLEKYVRTRSADPQKVLNHLLRRGFRYADIKRHMAGLEPYAEETNLEYNEYD